MLMDGPNRWYNRFFLMWILLKKTILGDTLYGFLFGELEQVKSKELQEQDIFWTLTSFIQENKDEKFLKLERKIKTIPLDKWVV